MIIFNSYKNTELLSNCLNSFKQFDTENHKILVCENSHDDSTKAVAEKFGTLYELCGPHYEAGGINRAFQKYPFEKEYFIFQDSVEFLCFEWEKIFRVPSEEKKCVGLSTFPLNHEHFDTIRAKNWYTEITNKPYIHETKPIFGNMFYAPNSIKDILIKNGCQRFIPTCKLDSCAMERVWPALLPKDLLAFTDEYTKNFWGWLYYIKKTWHNRQG